ncbi:HesB/IscA family protein [sulfur-oxidizing endosymbiont of Gigantopelta aegis]|uniref:HesB/IscA family protein n=1 Tax=sulfur-oxidizing endosymbiont of Gigantopelta aegis TaxID=2794934 RepID=UPI0018DB2EC1|nr:iron-sulfur cluster assembly accessory protein [sulfur-oxidizing endosymbiont of Gigantopelta aegis]
MIKLTEDAANQINAQIKNSGGESDPLRVAVTKHKNHKGFQYLMGFDKKNDNDSLYEIRGINIIIHNDLLEITKGMEIDYVEIEGEDNQFIFKNPNDPNYKVPTE